MSKVALVLQGPWHCQWLGRLPTYKDVFDEIVISTYWSEELRALLSTGILDGIRLVINDDWLPTGYTNTYNVFYQAKSTLRGCLAAGTEFVVKHRLDESFSNIEMVNGLLL